MKSRWLMLLLLVTALVVAACGGGEEDPTATDEPTPTEEATVEPTATEEEVEPTPTETAAATEEATEVAAAEGMMPYFGVTVQNTDADAPVEVFVDPEGPAAEAGLEDGDVITAIDGEAVTTANLAALMQTFAAGDEITVTVQRGDDDPQDFTVTLGEQEVSERPVMPASTQPFLGISVIFEEGAVRVVEVVPGSPAAEAGIEAGDIILSVNGDPLDSQPEMLERLIALRDGNTLDLSVQSGDEEFQAEVTTRAPYAFNAPPPGGFPTDTVRFEDGVWIIADVIPVGPLAEAGLEAGDRIVAVDGEVLTPEDIIRNVPTFGEDDTFTFEVERGDESLELEGGPPVLLSLSVAVGPQSGGQVQPGSGGGELPPFGNPREPIATFSPGESGTPVAPGRGQNPLSTYLGLSLAEPDTIATSDGTTYEGTLRIEGLIPELAGDEAGLQEGDLIVAVNDLPPEQFVSIAQLITPDQPDTIILPLTILRDGELVELEIDLSDVQLPPDTVIPIFPPEQPQGDVPDNFPPLQTPGGPPNS